MTNIVELLEVIKAEAMVNAVSELAISTVEHSGEIWETMKVRCGRYESALAVMCLLQAAVEDGAICANKFNNDECRGLIKLNVSIIDEGCMMIEDTGGVSVEVVKSNAEVTGAAKEPTGNGAPFPAGNIVRFLEA